MVELVLEGVEDVINPFPLWSKAVEIRVIISVTGFQGNLDRKNFHMKSSRSKPMFQLGPFCRFQEDTKPKYRLYQVSLVQLAFLQRKGKEQDMGHESLVTKLLCLPEAIVSSRECHAFHTSILTHHNSSPALLVYLCYQISLYQCF